MSMIWIPEGQYSFPAGLLIVNSSEKYSARIKFIPRDHTIPEEVKGLTMYWNGTEYDGWELDFGDGLTEEEADKLPEHYLGN